MDRREGRDNTAQYTVKTRTAKTHIEVIDMFHDVPFIYNYTVSMPFLIYKIFVILCVFLVPLNFHAGVEDSLTLFSIPLAPTNRPSLSILSFPRPQRIAPYKVQFLFWLGS